jgi:uncharacterized protein YceH (UPF0502 family)
MVLPLLTSEEIRVLGALIEKSQATPEYYPMTLNGLIAACNQKSSREPVVSYTEDTVDYTLEKLREKGLAATVSGTGRVVRHQHRIGNTGLGLTPAQAAVMSVLMLRGPQTASEIRIRTERQFRFPSLDFAQEVITGLMTDERPYVEEAPRRPGQKEIRYRHRFAVWPEESEQASEALPALSISDDIRALNERVEALASENASLRQRVEAIEKMLE